MKKILTILLAGSLLLIIILPKTDKMSILRRLKSDDPVQKQAAIEAVYANKIREALPDLLKIITQDESDEITIWMARKAIGRLSQPQDIKLLLPFIDSSKSFSLVGWKEITDIAKKIDPDWPNHPDIQALYPLLRQEFILTKNEERRIYLFHYLFLINSRKSEDLIFYYFKKGLKIDVYYDDDVLGKINELKQMKFFSPVWKLFKEYKRPYRPDSVIKTLDILDDNWRNLPQIQQYANDLEKDLRLETHLDGKLNSLEKFYAIRPQAAVKYFLQIGRNKKINDKKRRRILEILSEMRCQAAFPLFVDGLKSNDNDIKKISIRALGRLKNHKAIRFLIPFLQDSDYHIVGEAISSLGESGAAEACQALITMLQNDKSGFTSVILEALFALGEPRAFELAHNFLEKTSDNLRFEIIDLLIPHWNKNQLDEIVDNFHKAEDREKKLWLKTLAELKDSRALPILKEALQYKDLDIRAYAEWAIYHISH